MLPIVKKENEATEGENETLDYVLMTKEEVAKLIEKGKLRGIVLDNVNFVKIRTNGVLETKKANDLEPRESIYRFPFWTLYKALNQKRAHSKLRDKLEKMLNEDDELTNQLKELGKEEWDMYVGLLVLFYNFFSEKNTIDDLSNYLSVENTSDVKVILLKMFVSVGLHFNSLPLDKEILTKLYYLVEENDLANEFKINGNLLKVEERSQ